MNALKDAAINSNKLRKVAGELRQGPIFNKRQTCRAHCKGKAKTKHDQIYKRFTQGTLG